MSPVWVRPSPSPAVARPKSATQTVPWVSSSKLDGLMSRCSTPGPAAYSSARATWMPIRATLHQYDRPVPVRLDPPGRSDAAGPFPEGDAADVGAVGVGLPEGAALSGGG